MVSFNSSRLDEISVLPAPSVSFMKIAFAPRFLANSTSVKRSPKTKEFSRSYCGLFKYLVNIPVLGLRVGAFSSGKVLSTKISSKTTPSFSKAFKMKFCVGQNVSSGKLSVPNPS